MCETNIYRHQSIVSTKLLNLSMGPGTIKFQDLQTLLKATLDLA